MSVNNFSGLGDKAMFLSIIRLLKLCREEEEVDESLIDRQFESLCSLDVSRIRILRRLVTDMLESYLLDLANIQFPQRRPLDLDDLAERIRGQQDFRIVGLQGLCRLYDSVRYLAHLHTLAEIINGLRRQYYRLIELNAQGPPRE